MRYESLVRNTSAELARLFGFLEEAYEEEQILSFWTKRETFNGYNVSAQKTFDDAAMDHETLRAAQFNSPLYDGWVPGIETSSP